MSSGSASDGQGTVPRRAARRPARAPERARLVAVYPPEARGTIPLDGPRTLLGRDGEEGVTALHHPTVSRRHFAIDRDPGTGLHRGVDLGSLNGSWVDGADARVPRPLLDGSVVRVADVYLICERLPARDEDAPEVSRDQIPGVAATVAALRARIARAARDRSPILLIGETGTGKERIAAEIHRLSGRAGPYLTVNCAALARELAESQLFGHLRGAFTGAGEAQPGLFRAADGGTLLLDEVGELPLDLQAKLLRALEGGEVHPLGSPRPVRVDVRVVAATHRNLAALSDAGAFRRDLYARLALWEIHVPSLRERRADLLDWLDRFVALRRAASDRGPLELDPDAAGALLLAAWPTNLRGLDRLAHELDGGAAGHAIGPSEIPAWVGGQAPATGAATPRPSATQPPDDPGLPPPAPSREEFLAEYEALAGNVRALARRFGRDRRQIYRWIDAHGARPRG